MGFHLIENDDLKARLKRVIEIRHGENPVTEAAREMFADKSHPELPDMLKMMVDQISGYLCLCDLAGYPPEMLIQCWVEKTEERHPELKK